MQFISKTEWYLFILAAITLSLIYYVAFDKNVGAVGSATTGLIGKVLGQTSSGQFQKPF